MKLKMKKIINMIFIGIFSIVFVFDSCFSGSIFALSPAIPKIISYKTAKPVRQFITSGSMDETVPDKSVFKMQFIDGINGEADKNHDGYGQEINLVLVLLGLFPSASVT
jgi:hypothetical protein